MEKNNDILSEISDIAPGLSKLEKKNNFSTPTDYFDDLSTDIQDKIRMKSSHYHKTARIWFGYPQIAVAASVILIIVVAFFYLNQSEQKQYADNTIYWDEILNDNTLIDKVEEYQLIDAYIELTANEKQNDNKVLINESEEIENELANDIFTEI